MHFLDPRPQPEITKESKAQTNDTINIPLTLRALNHNARLLDSALERIAKLEGEPTSTHNYEWVLVAEPDENEECVKFYNGDFTGCVAVLQNKDTGFFLEVTSRGIYLIQLGSEEIESRDIEDINNAVFDYTGMEANR